MLQPSMAAGSSVTAARRRCVSSAWVAMVVCTIYHGRKGEMTRVYYEGMEDQRSALGLVLNCAVVWNTVRANRALAQLGAGGYPVLDADNE